MIPTTFSQIRTDNRIGQCLIEDLFFIFPVDFSHQTRQSRYQIEPLDDPKTAVKEKVENFIRTGKSDRQSKIPSIRRSLRTFSADFFTFAFSAAGK